jgi:putative membrane protein
MRFLLPVHVAANLLWIGSIVAVGLLLARGPGDAKARGEAGRLIYRSLAAPSFVASFVLGIVVMAGNMTYYMKTTHFMHAKLVLALIVIGLHHAIGARAKKMAEGKVADEGPAWGMSLGLFATASLVAYVAVMKPFLRLCVAATGHR